MVTLGVLFTGSFAYTLPQLPFACMHHDRPAKRRGCGNCGPPFSVNGGPLAGEDSGLPSPLPGETFQPGIRLPSGSV